MPDSGRWALASRQLMKEVDRRLGTWQDFLGGTLADLPLTTLTLEKRMVH